MRPSPESFRYAALRTDPKLWGSPMTTADDTRADRVDEPVMSARGVRAYAEPRHAHRRFSVGATFLGWSVAAFFTILFSGLASVALGAGALGVETIGISGLATAGFIAYLLASFAAYVIGGYAAGRIALWDGVRHGLGTVAWAVLFAIVAILGASVYAVELGLADSFAIDAGALTALTIVGIVLVLVAMLAGAALGGAWGERYHDRVHGVEPKKRGLTRGRPL